MIYFTTGPSKVTKKTKNYYKQALKKDIGSICHRSKEFQNIYKETANSLRKLMKIPRKSQIFFLSSATEAMERIIQNTVKKHSFHFVNGAFSKRFYDFAKFLKKEPKKAQSTWGKGFDFEKINIPKETELICITQNETSTGVQIPEKEIHTIKRKHPTKLLAVDITSSVPIVNLNYNLVDIAFFSVQKCFGMPAGLGVIIVNEKALKRSEGAYHSFKSLKKQAEKYQTPETPNAVSIYVLGQVIKNMKIEKIRRQTEKKAKILYKFFKDSLLVKDERYQSKTVIILLCDSKKMINKAKQKGFIIGSGYGKHKASELRIANFPAHTRREVKQLIRSLR